MSIERRNDCPDCGGDLRQITLIERGHMNFQVEGLRYGRAEERKSFWRFSQPVEGDVVSLMCSQCGRILLYGVPKEDPVARHIKTLKETSPASPPTEDPFPRYD